MYAKKLAAALVACGILILTACGGGPTGPDQPGPPPVTFTLVQTKVPVQTYGINVDFALEARGCVQGGSVEFHILSPEPFEFVRTGSCSNWMRDTNTYFAGTGMTGGIPVGTYKAWAFDDGAGHKKSNEVEFTVLPAP